MRTALLVERFDARQGGAETYATRLAGALLRAGHGVDVFCRREGEPLAGAKVHVLPVSELSRAGRIAGFARACAEAVGEADFDVVLGIGRTLGQDVLRPPGGTVRAAREGTLRSLGNGVERSLRELTWKISPAARTTLAIEREQFSQPHVHFIANSKMVADDIRRDYAIADERIHIITTGVDTERFSPARCAQGRAAARKELGLRDGQLALALLAHNLRLKGFRPLLKACERLVRSGCDVRLLVAGAGTRESDERGVANLSLGEHVSFLGAVPDSLKVYAAADVVVHPTFYDPFSNVTLEAWACGLPVITTRFNGASELMTGELAEWVVADVNDAEGLSERIGALADADRRRAVGDACRKLAEGHDVAGHCAQVVGLFEDVLGSV